MHLFLFQYDWRMYVGGARTFASCTMSIDGPEVFKVVNRHTPAAENLPITMICLKFPSIESGLRGVHVGSSVPKAWIPLPNQTTISSQPNYVASLPGRFAQVDLPGL
jgi:hypothetical protein